MPGARLLVASSNPGKVAEFKELARDAGHGLIVEALPGFDSFPRFEETAETLAENAAGKAMHYSQGSAGLVMADDSGLLVTALGGEPGVRSSRYAGPEGDARKNIAKLLAAMRGKSSGDRAARFVCVLALARAGRVLAVFSGAVEGTILEAPRGSDGFGYDPVFYYEAAAKTFAEMEPGVKNGVSHRGRAFERLAAYVGETGIG